MMGVSKFPMDAMIEIVCGLITSCSTIICAMIAYRSEKNAKISEQERKKQEDRAQRRVTESMLSLKLMNANCELTVGTALAVKRGYANGELESGLQKVKEAQHEYEQFLQSVAVEDMIHDQG